MLIGSDTWKRLIADGAKDFHIDISPSQAAQFDVYARELITWNRKKNLTAITEPTEIAVKHFLDSIIPTRFLPSEASLLDIGSGAGFPGIPFKIMIPSLSVTLIDASRKKVNFLKHIIRLLDLKGIEARHIRAEELAKAPDSAPAFDVIVCRALTRLDDFVAMAIPMLAGEGTIIALKGMEMEMDITAGENITFADDIFSVDIQTYSLPFLDAGRSVIRLKRISHP